MGKLEAQGSGKLSSQTIINPWENASAISLRSGKKVESPIQKPPKVILKDKVEAEAENKKTTEQSQEKQSKPKSNTFANCISLPFSIRRNRSKKEELEKELLETFQKVEINIPLLNAIKQVPRYAKFLKELYTSKRKLKGNEVLSVGKNVSTIIQGSMYIHYPMYYWKSKDRTCNAWLRYINKCHASFCICIFKTGSSKIDQSHNLVGWSV